MGIFLMKKNSTEIICLTIGLIILLVGCQRSTMTSVAGINYTDENIAGFQISQPDNSGNRSPTQEAMAYGAGGRMCCYLLPYKWHEGLKVKLTVEPNIDLPITDNQYQHEYDKRRDEGSLYQYVEVDVSRYEPGKAQLLWIQFLPSKQYRAIATDLDPTNPNFPSDIKGWPVPSVAFRHKLWDEEVRRVQQILDFSLENKSKGNSEEDWKKTWGTYSWISSQSEKEKDNFSGYDDPRFRLDQ